MARAYASPAGCAGVTNAVIFISMGGPHVHGQLGMTTWKGFPVRPRLVPSTTYARLKAASTLLAELIDRL